MSRDKKVADGAVRFVLLDRLGHAVLRRDVPSADIMAVVGK
jgi:3-dehydroquinate synthetase